MKKSLVVFFTFLFLLDCFSQGPIITPLRSNLALKNGYSKISGIKRALNDTLKLPFFEDFTNEGIYPDSKQWKDSNVYVNTHFAISPPSYGVATFDNLDKKGTPYNPLSGNTAGVCDLLTSKPINLKNYINITTLTPYLPKDSIYFSFFYQPQGLGDILDGSDSLVLKFIDSFGFSRTVWKGIGSKTKPFKQVMIPIKNGIYLHKGFKFVFINYAKNTGNMNQWHIDYIRIKPSRTLHDTTMADVAINAAPYGPLRWYETMPYDHFKAGYTSNRSDTVGFILKNNNATIGVNYSYSIDVLSAKNTLLYTTTNNNNNIDVLAENTKKFGNVKLDTFSAKNPLVKFKYSITPGSNDGLPGVYSSSGNSNNSFIKPLQFSNVLAYDDGSAEGGFGLDYANLPPGPGYVAMKFETYKPDTLRGISVFFNRSVTDVSSKPFILMVWKSISLPPAVNMNNDVILKMDTIAFPTYLDTMNGFVNYVFDTAVVLPKGTFYIGWLQSAIYNLNVGYDNNYHYDKKVNYRNPNVYFSLNSYWENVAASITGSPMMRPILGAAIKSNVPNIGSVPSILNGLNLAIYPNPSNGASAFNIESPVSIRKVDLYDAMGQLVYTMSDSGIITVPTDALSSGFYTVILTGLNKQISIKKYIITK
jgi:hypothetical protein